MLSKLTRILLALVTAIVFTGQMEAAAEHCARLAEEAALAAEPAAETPACHETQEAAADSHAATGHHPSKPDAPSKGAAPDHCECIAALKACAEFDGATSSALVEPYAWLLPAATTFASSKPDPDLRPPRA